ncbi:MAG: hypothetical protein NZ908_00980 [Candidatus Micrarchaeota archaeon]|nr:hypothetical protein [Candidatus Micrarchaeota archaeon]MCX8154296.1 hypothetical protein [Candidatus Micrarchaeota archaeon]
MRLIINRDRGYFRVKHFNLDLVITSDRDPNNILYVNQPLKHSSREVWYKVDIPYSKISIFLTSPEPIMLDGNYHTPEFFRLDRLPENDRYSRALLTGKIGIELETQGYSEDIKMIENRYIQRLRIAETSEEPEFNMFLDYGSREIKILSKDRNTINILKRIAEGIIIYYSKLHLYTNSRDDSVRKNLNSLTKHELTKKILEHSLSSELEFVRSITRERNRLWLLPIGYDASLEYGLLYSKNLL